MSKYNVYISYATSDAELALAYLEKLSSIGITCFFDRNQGSVEQGHADSVQSAILDSRVMLFIYGKDSEESIEQRQELDYALENGKVVFYVLERMIGHGVIHTKLRKKCREGSIEIVGHYIDPRRFPLHHDVLCDIEYDRQITHFPCPQAAPSPAREPSSRPMPEDKVAPAKRGARSRGVDILKVIVVLSVLVFVALIVIRVVYGPTAPKHYNTQIAPELYHPMPMPEDFAYESMAYPDVEVDGDVVAEDEVVAEAEIVDEVVAEAEASAEESMQWRLEIEAALAEIENSESHTPDSTPENIIDEEVVVLDEQQISTRGEDNRWVVGAVSLLVGFAVGVGLVLLLRRRRKSSNVKLSSDVDVSISVDNAPLTSIGAGEVYATHLAKGEYIIDFATRETKVRHNRIVQRIEGKGPYVIFSPFGAVEVERKFKCFIAGSLALTAERDALRAVMAELHNQWEAEKFQINSYTFEDFNRAVVVGGQQKLYDRFIAEDADWIVFIIADGIGDKTMNEYRVAMDSYMKFGHPKILFLAHSDSTNDPVVKDIKREIVQSEQYWNSCNSVEQMKALLYKCLNWDITLLSKRAE